MAARKKTATAEHKHSPEHSADIKEAAKAVDAKNEKKAPRQRTDRKAIDRMLELRKKGLGVVRIARQLEAEGIKTATGKSTWHGPAIRSILAREMGDEAWAASKDARKLAGSADKATLEQSVEDASRKRAAKKTEDKVQA